MNQYQSLTLKETAQQLRLSTQRVKRLIDDGILAAWRTRDNGNYRIDQSEINRYKQSNKVEAPTS